MVDALSLQNQVSHQTQGHVMLLDSLMRELGCRRRPLVTRLTDLQAHLSLQRFDDVLDLTSEMLNADATLEHGIEGKNA